MANFWLGSALALCVVAVVVVLCGVVAIIVLAAALIAIKAIRILQAILRKVNK